MISLEIYIEQKEKNPLRKKELRELGVAPYNSMDRANLIKSFYREVPYDELDNNTDRVIKRKYEEFLKTSKSLADRYLNYEVKKILDDAKRTSTKLYKKVYEYMGVQVFIDEENIQDDNYEKGSYNYRIVQHSVMVMMLHIKDILPRRKPKILITSIKKHPLTSKDFDEDYPAIGMTSDKMMFIDQFHIDRPNIWIHEYAHWVVDMIPRQTQELMMDSFDKLIKMYYRIVKKRNPKKYGGELSEDDKMKISRKFGFPEYGLTNHDEFFAVLIENWKSLPNNKLTYKMKTLVKNTITRL